MKVTNIETIALSIPHPEGHQWLKGEISSTGWDLQCMYRTRDWAPRGELQLMGPVQTLLVTLPLFSRESAEASIAWSSFSSPLNPSLSRAICVLGPGTTAQLCNLSAALWKNGVKTGSRAQRWRQITQVCQLLTGGETLETHHCIPGLSECHRPAFGSFPSASKDLAQRPRPSAAELRSAGSREEDTAVEGITVRHPLWYKRYCLCRSGAAR